VLAFFEDEPPAGTGASLAAAVAGELGRPVRHVAWDGASTAGVHALLNEIAHAALVVTDAYHVALIAWNVGVPAIGISAGGDQRVFFSQYGALEFAVRPEELMEPSALQQRTRLLAQAARAAASVRAIAARVRTHAEVVEDALARDLRELLGRPRHDGVAVAAATELRARQAKPFKALAVMCVADEEVHIESALRDLIGEGLDVVLLDHDSGDRTVQLAQPFLGCGLLSIERLPWTGGFSIAEQLEAKRRIADQVEHDWIVHVDADQWLSAPAAGQTLLEGLREADAAGANAVHFNEFVFVPRPGEDVYAADYRARSTRYYVYRPHYPYLLRAWKHRSGLDNRPFAGHLLAGPVKQYAVDFPMRHYIALSEAHARRKYLGRAFETNEVARGFHYDRVGLTRDDLRFPAEDDPRMRTLEHWSSKDFDVTNPSPEHFWYWRSLSHANARAQA
jgi:hypothetical protein